MSDQLENFIRNNRDKLDQQSPGPELWDGLQQGLAQHAAAAGSTATSSAATAAKTGLGAKLSQVSTFWKAAAGVIATAAIGTAIFLATSTGGGGGPEGPGSAPVTSGDQPGGQKVELMEAAMPLVNPPLPSADIPFQTHDIDARKGGAWTLDNGTVITVPGGIFVDADGNKVKGAVTLHYREFHDAADIILSGIPMVYYDEGKPENFQTAGMTELRGTQGAENVYIAPGKSLQIAMASFVGPEGELADDYMLYFLDPEQRAWEEVGQAQLGRNTEKKKRLKMLPALPQKPRKPSKAEGENMDNAITMEVDYSEFPELRPFKNIVWEAVDKEYFRKNQWSLTRTWNDVRLEEVNPDANEYKLIFTNRKTTFEINVSPMLTGKDYDKALAKFQEKMGSYEKALVQREEEEKRIGYQADFRRTFQVSGFGIMNCDRYYNMASARSIKATVEVPDGAYARSENLLVYQVTGNNRAVVTRSMADMQNFRYIPEDDNLLVIILGDGKAATVDNQAIEKAVATPDYQKTGEATLKFQMVDREIKTAADLRIILNI